ncbi:hypothetical protein P175DRAFT_0559947 [Aspergillus ochraceoroseus IBT 24754]|uniref:Uncharacterized protein n=1 Tax=Aspergillus ochraceoroseus IBT 24754 TaxID=1392256 RepID=A0A2T5LP47_9EURO|nr:uncharacterized protein P175DRAFT_0559947 [Aspergillus ochraceoroseus IBT 24754]PTU18048.1 hypothetical protein P175DRAFT_0559947 [Aspergillus ochraceoroseus IBT 24754]
MLLGIQSSLCKLSMTISVRTANYKVNILVSKELISRSMMFGLGKVYSASGSRLSQFLDPGVEQSAGERHRSRTLDLGAAPCYNEAIAECRRELSVSPTLAIPVEVAGEYRLSTTLTPQGLRWLNSRIWITPEAP